MLRSLFFVNTLVCITLFGTSQLLGDVFEHRIGDESSFYDHLHETDNVVMHHEHWSSTHHVDYWAPEFSSTWGSVTYRYELPFEIRTAVLDPNLYVHHGFDSQAQGRVEVSANGLDWTRIAGIDPESPAGASNTRGQYDLAPILRGSNTAYVRGWIYQDRATGGSFAASQFARSHFPFPGDSGYSGLTFQASSVPEPGFLPVCLVIGGLVAARRRKRV